MTFPRSSILQLAVRFIANMLIISEFPQKGWELPFFFLQHCNYFWNTDTQKTAERPQLSRSSYNITVRWTWTLTKAELRREGNCPHQQWNHLVSTKKTFKPKNSHPPTHTKVTTEGNGRHSIFQVFLEYKYFTDIHLQLLYSF